MGFTFPTEDFRPLEFDFLPPAFIPESRESMELLCDSVRTRPSPLWPRKASGWLPAGMKTGICSAGHGMNG